MSDFEEVKRNATHAFGAALRASPLVGKVDSQRTVLALGKIMEPLGELSTLDLTDLYRFLLSQELDAKDVAELLIFFHSRADQLRLPMSLPAEVEALPQAARDAAIEKYRAATSDSIYKREVSSPKAKVPAGASGEVSGRQKTMFDDMKPSAVSKTGPSPLLYLGLAIALVAAGAMFVSARGGSPAQPVEYVDDPAGLGCTKVVGGKSGALCEIPLATFEQMDKEEFRTRAEMTVKKLNAQGYERVLIVTAEDQKLRPY